MGNSLSGSLLLAARTGNANGVRQLVAQGVDVHSVVGEDEKTALHVAAEEGRDEVVTVLVSFGAKVSTVDKQKYTPLHSAVFMGHASTAAILIANGADINAKDVSGMTPLHWAIKTAKTNCVELLISKGADLKITNGKGEDALALANKVKPRKLRPDIVSLVEGVLNGGPVPSLVEVLPQLSARDNERVMRLRNLCIIWGIVKYAHPHVQYKSIDWDGTLLKTISKINNSSSPTEYCAAVDSLLQVFGDANTRAVLNSANKPETRRPQAEKTEPLTLSITEDHYALITLGDSDQFHDFSKARTFVKVFTEARVKAKGIVFDCRCEESGNVSSVIFLKQMFYEAFRIFINDVLPLPASRTRIYRGHHLEWNRFDSDNYFEGALTTDGEVLLPPATPKSSTPRLPTGSSTTKLPPATPTKPAAVTDSPSTPIRAASVPLPASPALLPQSPAPSANPPLSLSTPLPATPIPQRAREEQSEEKSETASGEKEKPVVPSIANDSHAKDPTPLMGFIVNKSTPACLIDLISALQAKDMAFAVFEDSSLKVTGDDVKVLECGVPTIKVDVSEDVTVFIRTADRINPDGTVGFSPDLVVSPSDDLPDQVMLKLRGSQFSRGEGQFVGTPVRSPPTSGYTCRPRESEYSVDNLTPEVRLLSLFKFWNVVEFFYPYKDTFTEDWTRVLLEFIPAFEEVGNPLDYSLAVARLVSRLHDTHAYASSPILNEYMGTHVPPVSVQRLEEHTIFTFVDPSLGESGPRVGDELVSIDGVEEPKVREKLAKIIPASTPQAKSWRIDQLLLAGKLNSTVTIVTKGASGEEATFVFNRTTHPSLTPSAVVAPLPGDNIPPYRVVEVGIGYIDTVRLNVADIDKALDSVKDQACLIIDVRGFPHDTLQKLVARLTHSHSRILQTNTPLRISSSFAHANASVVTEVLSILPHPNSINYQGKVVVLVNEKTASFAEQQLLYLESVCANVCGGVTFVGSPTNGSVGKMTNIKLPGEIFVGLSGVGMKGINGKVVQGVGIKPSVVVEPTVAGVLAREDEVFNGALKYCKSYLQSPTSPIFGRRATPNDASGAPVSDNESSEAWPEV